MSDVAIQSFIQCLHLKAMMSPKYTESEPVRRSKRGTVNVSRVRISENFPDSKIFVAKTFRIKRVNCALLVGAIVLIGMKYEL